MIIAAGVEGSSPVLNITIFALFVAITLAIVGAVVGGFLFSLVGAAPVTGLNIYSMIVAVIGAVVVLFVWSFIQGRSRSV